MDIENAWYEFEKTGKIESYLHYKDLCDSLANSQGKVDEDDIKQTPS